jgi:hypothetical protein
MTFLPGSATASKGNARTGLKLQNVGASLSQEIRALKPGVNVAISCVGPSTQQPHVTCKASVSE